MNKITVSISREDLKNHSFTNRNIVSVENSNIKVDLKESIVELLKTYYK